ncbi:MAG: LysM peptidoglycan-binding domain-containing protein [Flavobacteriales bacterium]|nr:LysM peptidoglycan-binding domain-containing protein [Flavobacteriales bacterium]
MARAQGRTNNSHDLRTLYQHCTEGQRDVLPLLMAFIHLSTHAQELGIAPIEVIPFEAADSVRVESELHFAAIATVMGLPVPRLRAMNPLLCSDRVPPFERLRLPRGERDRFVQLTDSIIRVQQQLHQAPVPPYSGMASAAPVRTADGREAIHYRVRSGDYLGSIAMRFGVKVSQIKTWNKLRSDRISAGDRLLIYVPASQRARYERHSSAPEDEPTNRTVPAVNGANANLPSPVADFTWYTVQTGDSLYGIAQRYPGVEAKDLMQVNGISADIKPGQKLKIPVQP